MPRNSAADAAVTRTRIVDAAVARASRVGLEGVTVGEHAKLRQFFETRYA